MNALSFRSSSSFQFYSKSVFFNGRKVSFSSSKIPNNQFKGYNGLISGLSKISTANYYSEKLPLIEAYDLVKKNRFLYDIVEKECESDPDKIDKHLEDMETKMDEFLRKNKVWDRSELFLGLDGATRKKGNFTCLLGGKSTGKSLVLGEFSGDTSPNKKVIYVDMRRGFPSITHGFIRVINENKKTFEIIWNTIASVFTELLQGTKIKGPAKVPTEGGEIPFELEISFQNVLKETTKEPIEILEILLKKIVQDSPYYVVITLVVDEANLPLTITDKTSEAKIEQVKAVLSLFTTLTKQQKKVNDFSKIFVLL